MKATKSGCEGGLEAPATLRALLYADPTKIPVPESQWADLVRQVAEGDQAALRDLYERTHRIVFTLLVRILNDRQNAEELMVDVFHDVWRRAPRYDVAGGTVVGWIMNMARSRAIDRIRFERRKKRVRPAGEPRAAAIEAAENLQLRQRGRELRRALDLLTPDERQAIEIAYFSGFSYAETAAKLEQPVGTIKTRIRAGLAKLRQALSEG